MGYCTAGRGRKRAAKTTNNEVSAKDKDEPVVKRRGRPPKATQANTQDDKAQEEPGKSEAESKTADETTGVASRRGRRKAPAASVKVEDEVKNDAGTQPSSSTDSTAKEDDKKSSSRSRKKTVKEEAEPTPPKPSGGKKTQSQASKKKGSVAAKEGKENVDTTNVPERKGGSAGLESRPRDWTEVERKPL